MASSDSSFERSVLLRQWTWPLRVAFWTCVVATGCWIFGMLAQAYWAREHAPEDPVAYQVQRLEVESQSLDALRPSVVSPSDLAQSIGRTLHGWALAAATVVARTLMNIPGQTREWMANEALRHSADPGGEFARRLLDNAGADWDLLVLGTYGFAVRTAMYAAIAPVLALSFAIGAADGWVTRARRKANAGRESASLYHRAKLGVTFVLITGYLVCLGLPRLDAPEHLLVPLAVTAGFLLRLQVGFYKKYL